MMNAMLTTQNIQTGNNDHTPLMTINGKSKSRRLTRRRSSTIDNPSDSLNDAHRDSLVKTSSRANQGCSAESRKHSRQLSVVIRYLYETKRDFDRALELFNRKHCCEVNNMWATVGSFFECKGALRVVQRMCTRCRDGYKLKTITDLYYVDLTERTRERTVLCHGCIGKIVVDEVGVNDTEIKATLKHLRHKQKLGIIIVGRQK